LNELNMPFIQCTGIKPIIIFEFWEILIFGKRPIIT